MKERKTSPDAETVPPFNSRRRGALLGILVVFAIVLSITIAVAWPRQHTPSPARTSASPPTVVNSDPVPTPTGFAANTKAYEVDALPVADVFAVLPQLPVDADPSAPFAGYTAHPRADLIPVWADPLGEPVAALPNSMRYGGTTVAVVEKQPAWVRVLLTGRQALP